MRSILLALFALLLGTGSFVAATGLTGTTLTLRADAVGFADTVIGAVMAAYFAGFVLGTYVGPTIIARTGHIRAFAVFAASAGAAVLLHPIFVGPPSWALLRVVTGVCVVGMYMVVESWLNERTTNERRGKVFAAYQAVSLASLALGQYLLLVDPGSETTPFLLAGALFALSLLPVALTRIPEPVPIRPVRLNIRYLWSVSPLGVLGTAVTAFAGGVFFALGPLFARHAGMDTGEVAVFMSSVILGGVILQWPIGHLSDVVDRRSIILGVSLAGSLLAGAAFLVADRWPAVFFGIAFLYGGTVFSLYPLCVAHTNDHTPPEEMVKTASGLLLVYGMGATVGPVLTGPLMGQLGGGVFFGVLSAVLGVLALSAILRMFLRPAPPVDAQEPFVIMSRTSQSALEMLPDATDAARDASRD